MKIEITCVINCNKFLSGARSCSLSDLKELDDILTVAFYYPQSCT